MPFAILRDENGLRHWYRINSPGSTAFTGARLPPPAELLYPDRDTAERDAETLRVENAHRVEATKRQRKWKTLPATYTVMLVE